MRTTTIPLVFAALCGVALCACSNSDARTVTGARAPATAAASIVSKDASGSGHTATFTTNGAFGNVDQYSISPDGLSYAETYLEVDQGGTPSAPLTFLFYDTYKCSFDPTNYWYTCSDVRIGEGLIPNGDLSGGAGALHLYTNTAVNPSFYVLEGSAGVIDVTFRKSNLSTLRSEGTTEESYYTFSMHSSGESESTAATVQGTILGEALTAGPSGYMGTNHSTVVYRTSR